MQFTSWLIERFKLLSMDCYQNSNDINSFRNPATHHTCVVGHLKTLQQRKLENGLTYGVFFSFFLRYHSERKKKWKSPVIILTPRKLRSVSNLFRYHSFWTHNINKWDYYRFMSNRIAEIHAMSKWIVPYSSLAPPVRSNKSTAKEKSAEQSRIKYETNYIFLLCLLTIRPFFRSHRVQFNQIIQFFLLFLFQFLFYFISVSSFCFVILF